MESPVFRLLVDTLTLVGAPSKPFGAKGKLDHMHIIMRYFTLQCEENWS